MDLVTLLSPQTLALLGPIGIIWLITVFGFYKVFSNLVKKYEDIQEKRVQEAHDMQKEYFELAKEVDKTLEILVRTLERKNGNSHG